MKKLLVLVFALTAIVLAACSNGKASNSKDGDVVKVGIRISEEKTWQLIKEKAAKEGIDLKLEILSAQVDPDQLLVDGDIDINAYQHLAVLDLFNKAHKTDLVPVGTTIIAPLGMYSKKHKSIDDLKDGATIAVPNDPSNWGRALLLLQKHNLITLTDNFDGNGGKDRIKSNPKNLKIQPADAATLPRVLEDVDFAIINNGVALQAGLYLKDALIAEDKTAKPYINVIAANKKDENSEVLKKIVDIYHSKEVADFINKTYKKNYIPVDFTLEEIADWKDTYNVKK